MGTLTLFAFGSPARDNDPFTSGIAVYPEVKVEVDGSVLASSFFVSGTLAQYNFPTSFNDIIGHNVRIHYLNDFAYSSNLAGDDPICFASSTGLENRALFVAAVILNMGVFSWDLANFVPSEPSHEPVFSIIDESGMAISMDDFTALMGSNVRVKANSSGILRASVGVAYAGGFIEFDL